MVKAVLFDLDGTLWDRDAAATRVFEAQHDEFEQLHGATRQSYVARMLDLDAHGIGDKHVAYAQIAGELQLECAMAERLLDDFWRRYASFFEPYPEVLATLRELRSRGVQLGIITNGTAAVQEAKIRGLGLEPLMDVILISEREGIRKPDPAIFVRALQRLDVRPNEAWFVGDHPDADVRGAHEAGLTAVWRRSWGKAPEASHIVTSLVELLRLTADTSV